VSLILDEHRQYLADETRVAAFRKAVEAVLRPGDVVLDLGSGTGILGLLACRAGAGRVYSIELGGMIGLAREISKANGFAGKQVFLKGHSMRVELPEKVDLVVSDQIGRFGFEAGVIQCFRDARKRFLKPGGIMIPMRIQQWIGLVESPENWSQIEFWNNSSTGFDLSPAHEIAANTGYPITLQRGQLLGEPARGASLDLHSFDSDSWDLSTTLVASRAGTLHGIGGWFSAELAPGVSMTNSPLAPDRIDRRNVFLPINRGVELNPGDRVRVAMHVIPSELVLTWRVEILSGDRVREKFTHSTMRGFLMTREDLQSTRPDSIPKLNRWGQGRRTVLELCDGHRTLAEIERELLRRHPELFPSLKEAAVFVAEVVTRYSV
jgi:SAM-dependent methyltransferase